MEYGASCTPTAGSVLAGCVRGDDLANAMFRVTAGVNTHGQHFLALGLLCAAIGRLYPAATPADRHREKHLRYRRFLPRPDRTRTAPG